MSEILEDCVFPRSMFDRIVSWKESWLRDGDQTRRLKLANQVVGVLPRILRHIRHIERKIGTQWQRIAMLEAENATLKSTVASLLSIDDSKVSEYVVLDAEALKQAAGNRVAELQAQVQRLAAPVSDEDGPCNSINSHETWKEWESRSSQVEAINASRSTPPAQEQPVDAQKGKQP